MDYAAAGSRAAFARGSPARWRTSRPQLLVLAGFMRILDTAPGRAVPGRMLNVHPSLLPKYPGLHTYRRALEAGDQEHGATVHFVIPELDAGPGILQYRIADSAGRYRDIAAGTGPRRRTPDLPAGDRLGGGRPAALRDGAVWLDGERLAAPVVVAEEAAAPRTPEQAVAAGATATSTVASAPNQPIPVTVRRCSL